MDVVIKYKKGMNKLNLVFLLLLLTASSNLIDSSKNSGNAAF